MNKLLQQFGPFMDLSRLSDPLSDLKGRAFHLKRDEDGILTPTKELKTLTVYDSEGNFVSSQLVEFSNTPNTHLLKD